MTLVRRGWRGWDDLVAMQRLLARSLADDEPSAFVHPGDLAWWLGWPPKDVAWFADAVALWEDEDGLRAWAMIDDDEVGEWIDTAHDHDAAWAAIDAWLLERPNLLRYTREDDIAAIARLQAMGYRGEGDGMVTFTIELAPFAGDDADPRVRPVLEPEDVAGRASVTRSAFESYDRPWETYLAQYRAFVAGPAYPKGWDLVAWAGPGRAAACTIAWPDVDSGVGNFEPVATHPAFQRHGYGTAVLREGCRRLARAGMHRAIVRTGAGNVPAIALYRSVGFIDAHREVTFRRP
jgi:GNAT superfamily N-acetyltransferase